jgi:hypothetical protein
MKTFLFGIAAVVAVILVVRLIEVPPTNNTIVTFFSNPFGNGKLYPFKLGSKVVPT